jgi:hypothetical protein
MQYRDPYEPEIVFDYEPDRQGINHAYPFNSFRSILGIGSNTESLTYAELYDADCKHPSFTDVAFVGGV